MAQYSITNAHQCVVIDDDMTFSQAASYFINPLTALGLVEQVTNDKGQAVILTAAASQLAKMMINIFNDSNITVIAIVRRDEQVQELKEEYKLEHVFNSETEPDFLPNLKKLTREVN